MPVLFSVHVIHPDVQSNYFDPDFGAFSDMIDITFHYDGFLIYGNYLTTDGNYCFITSNNEFACRTYRLISFDSDEDVLSTKFKLMKFNFTLRIRNFGHDRITIYNQSGDVILISNIHQSFNLIFSNGHFIIQPT